MAKTQYQVHDLIDWQYPLSAWFGDDVYRADFQLVSSNNHEVETWQLSLDGQLYCVRRFHDPAAFIREMPCLLHASNLQLAPSILWQHDQLVVTDWLHGRQWQVEDYQHDKTRQALLKQLKKLHQSNQVLPPCVETQSRIHGYLQEMALPARYHELLQISDKLADTLGKKPLQIGCIHNDLHAGNLVFSADEFQFIDWSEAGRGDIGNDLAEILLFMPSAQQEIVFREYFDADPTTDQMNQLTQHCLLRIALFAAWGLGQARVLTTDFVIPSQPNVQDQPTLELATYLRNCLSGKIEMRTSMDYLAFSEFMLMAFNQRLGANHCCA